MRSQRQASVGCPGSPSTHRTLARGDDVGNRRPMGCLLTGCIQPGGPRPQGLQDAADWHYVGEGRGGFAKVHNYSYVGVGGGDWEKQTVTYYRGWRPRPWVLAFLAFFFLVAGAMLMINPVVMTKDSGHIESSHHKVLINTVPPTTSDQLFDCHTDGEWTQSKKAWCCQNQGERCGSSDSAQDGSLPSAQPLPPQAPAPASSSPPPATAPPARPEVLIPATTVGPHFDCNEGFVDCQDCVQELWTPEKQTWCCEHGGRGCPPPPSTKQPPAQPVPPLPVLSSGQQSPAPPPATMATTSYGPAATHKKRATVPAPTTSPLPVPYDCDIDYSDCKSCLLHRWSPTKRAFCCKRMGRGCDPKGSANATKSEPTDAPTASESFDCASGFGQWAQSWSFRKKAWCCVHERRGCPPETEKMPFDCREGLSEWQKAWSVPKKAWCCQHAHKGCPPQLASVPYDCSEDVHRWSERKRVWCCKHDGRGCPTTKQP